MPAIPRRVVTGHDERGVSVFAADGPVPVVRTAPDGALFCEIWSTGAMPAPIAAAEPDPIVLDGELLDSLGGDVLGGLLHDPMKGEA
jgi:hypothetical protein